LCGITTFNALRHGGGMPGDLVAAQGIGGLGHLGVQFASKFGYRVVAISRGKEAEVLAFRRMVSGKAQFQWVLTMQEGI
jgi:D-arabinose 1-dehydrogenase-like Zn-dependent alcohol dehydrogenase